MSCGTEPVYSNPLTPGATVEEVLDATQTTLDLIGLIPGVGEPFDAASGLISAVRGDYTGAVLSAGALIPFIGDVAGATKIGRRLASAADSVSDVARRGPSLDPNAPHNKTIREVASQISDGTIINGGGILPEKLIPTPGGIKSGRRPDILVQRPDGKKYGINIGRQTKKGLPYKREAEAINDLEGAGIPMYFVP